ncbi:hypothetical protein FGM00_17555 [Aggregatimonas sangjinii]|uniref:Uncharacterized protein n=1 Tax=Aggregatimonas sangjinii TaxID=2583587 RepID=A0A5B7SYG7_9FLAO|nr:hypothetical protein [Aggregatimonas sangjinii]QCX01834.1 hypothetical protein FGM00_17555 [Aggregatimonas sangjinii]
MKKKAYLKGMHFIPAVINSTKSCLFLKGGNFRNNFTIGRIPPQAILARVSSLDVLILKVTTRKGLK